MKQFKTIEEIKAERTIQRSNKTIHTLLNVVLAELDRRPDLTKEPTEDDIYKVIKKLYEAAIECSNLEEELYLRDFIKKQLSTEELTTLVYALRDSGMTTIGEMMKYLSTNYTGQYDGREASQIVKKAVDSLKV